MANRIDCDWQETGTMSDLENTFGDAEWYWNDLKPMWVEEGTDTFLITRIDGVSGPVLWNIKVWNRPGIRAEFAALLGLPVTVE